MTEAQLRTQFSSKKDDWETPQELFDQLDRMFHFTLDAASSDQNAKCEKHFTAEDDGLKQNWGGRSGMAESSLRTADWKVGTESLRRKPKA